MDGRMFDGMVEGIVVFSLVLCLLFFACGVGATRLYDHLKGTYTVKIERKP